MKILGKLLLTLANLAYPLLWYYGKENGAPFWLAAAMCVLWLICAAMPQATAQRTTAIILVASFAAVLVFRRPDSTCWYPVAVNTLILVVFGGSLFTKQAVIERLARLQRPDLPPEGVRHTRRVTQIWCVFFIFNGTTAAILAGLRYYNWQVVYTGIVSYVLARILFTGELTYRKLVLKV